MGALASSVAATTMPSASVASMRQLARPRRSTNCQTGTSEPICSFRSLSLGRRRREFAERFFESCHTALECRVRLDLVLHSDDLLPQHADMLRLTLRQLTD